MLPLTTEQARAFTIIGAGPYGESLLIAIPATSGVHYVDMQCFINSLYVLALDVMAITAYITLYIIWQLLCLYQELIIEVINSCLCVLQEMSLTILIV